MKFIYCHAEIRSLSIKVFKCSPCIDPWVGKIPGEGNGNPLQYSCLGNHMDRGGWQATVHGVPKVSDMTEAT